MMGVNWLQVRNCDTLLLLGDTGGKLSDLEQSETGGTLQMVTGLHRSVDMTMAQAGTGA